MLASFTCALHIRILNYILLTDRVPDEEQRFNDSGDTGDAPIDLSETDDSELLSDAETHASTRGTVPLRPSVVCFFDGPVVSIKRKAEESKAAAKTSYVTAFSEVACRTLNFFSGAL